MQIGAVGFSPFVYNTNAVSSASMNKVPSIGKDALASKTDFSGLTLSGENQNPLKKGQTANWMDVLSMQMQMSQQNAARVMKPAEDTTETANQAVTATNATAATENTTAANAAMNTADSGSQVSVSQADNLAVQASEQSNNVSTLQIQPVDQTAVASQASNNVVQQQTGNAMMQRAADAYMSMMMVS